MYLFILRLFPILKTILAHGYNHVTICVKIIENYILLGTSTFFSVCNDSFLHLNSFQGHFPLLVELLTRLVDDVIEDGVVAILKVMDVLLLLLPRDAVMHLFPALKKVLILLLSEKVHLTGDSGFLILGLDESSLALCDDAFPPLLAPQGRVLLVLPEA